jgi:hypothetical protein
VSCILDPLFLSGFAVGDAASGLGCRCASRSPNWAMGEFLPEAPGCAGPSHKPEERECVCVVAVACAGGGFLFVF